MNFCILVFVYIVVGAGNPIAEGSFLHVSRSLGFKAWGHSVSFAFIGD